MDQDDVQPECDSPPIPVGRLVHLHWLDAIWLLDLIQEAERRRGGAEYRIVNEKLRQIAADLRRQIAEVAIGEAHH